MGSWVSSKVGYGIAVPFTGEDSSEELYEWLQKLSPEAKEFVDQYVEVEGEDSGYPYAYFDEDSEGEWEFFEALEKKFSGVERELQYVHDYSSGSVLLTKSTVQSSYSGFDVFKITEPVESEVAALKALAEFLALEFDPDWWVVSSYG